jgi:hypothetical protein
MLFERISDARVVQGFGVCVLFYERGGGIVRREDGFDVRLTEREAAILEALIEVAPVRLPCDNGWKPKDARPVPKRRVRVIVESGRRCYETLSAKLPGLIDSTPGRRGGVRLNSFVLGFREGGSLVVPGPWRDSLGMVANLRLWAEACELEASIREE